MEWQLADAEDRFSELMDRALIEGPQRVMGREATVIVMAQRDYEKLAGMRPDFKEFLLSNRPSLTELDITRDRAPLRDADGYRAHNT